jgi:hypothetical protein
MSAFSPAKLKRLADTATLLYFLRGAERNGDVYNARTATAAFNATVRLVFEPGADPDEVRQTLDASLPDPEGET